MSKTLILAGFFVETGKADEPYRPILTLKMDAPPAIREGDLITINEGASNFLDETAFIRLIAEHTHTHRVQSIRHVFTQASEDIGGYLLMIRLAKTKKPTQEDFEVVLS